MSELTEALKDHEQEFWISDEERISLIEIMAMTATAIRSGKLWFNHPGPANTQYADLLESVARRFANMPVAKEQ